MEILGTWSPLPQPPDGKKVRSGQGGAPHLAPRTPPWHYPPPIGEGPGGWQAGRAGKGRRWAWQDRAGLAASRGRSGRAQASRAPPSSPSGPSGRVTSRSPAAWRPGRHEAALPVRRRLLRGRAGGGGAGAGWRAGSGPSSPPRPLTTQCLDPLPPDPRRMNWEEGGGGREIEGMDGAFGDTV